MYTDIRSKKTALIAVLCAALLLIFGAVWLVLGGSGDRLGEESALAIEDAVKRSALQCFVVEGVYPPNLAYLEDNYGLQVNTREFYVVYDAFASNLPPTVRVIRK